MNDFSRDSISWMFCLLSKVFCTTNLMKFPIWNLDRDYAVFPLQEPARANVGNAFSVNWIYTKVVSYRQYGCPLEKKVAKKILIERYTERPIRLRECMVSEGKFMYKEVMKIENMTICIYILPSFFMSETSSIFLHKASLSYLI